MKFNKAIIPLLITSCLSLTGCSFIFNILSFDPDASETETSYDDHFVDTEGNTVYLYLDVTEKNLLPNMQVQIKLDLADEGEEPDFAGKWSGVTWSSEDIKVATVDDGLVTAVNPGSTRIQAKIFSCATYAEITVFEKELDHVTIENPRTTFIKDKTFVPSFNLVANLKGGFTEEITDYEVDSSSVDMTTIGNYPVIVSGTYLDKPFSASYSVDVKDVVAYTPKYLDYTQYDLAHNNSYAANSGWVLPNAGNIKSLVIPLWFTNSGTMISDKAGLRETIATAFNGEAQPNGWNSVKSYYYALSNGLVNYNATISSWYETDHPFSFYFNSDTEWRLLVINALNWYFDNNPSESRASYDSDHNGVFDSICFIYGSNESEQGYISFQNFFNKGDSDYPGLKYVMWASAFEAIADTEHSPADSHVYIHETGHMFGLNDYYDYGGDTRPAGGFNMQEHNTGSHESYSITTIGWGKVIVPETDTIIELEDYESSHVAILLSTHPETHNSPFDEYMLLELFAPTGTKKFDSTYAWRGYYSTGPQEAGIRLWHVDSRLTQRVAGVYSTDLITDPTTPDSDIAFSNTSTGTNHGSRLGEEYNKYSQLFNVRNNAPDEDYYGNKIKVINEEHLFRAGDSFKWSDFTNQFTDGEKMDSGETFNWTFSIDSITTQDGKYVATINIERL